MARIGTVSDYVTPYEFSIQKDVRPTEAEYRVFRTYRELPTLEKSQAVDKIPEDTEPYTKKFPFGLRFHTRVVSSFVDYLANRVSSLGLPVVSSDIVIASSPSRVNIHIDNGMYCCLIVPMIVDPDVHVWMYTRPYLIPVTSFTLELNKAYLVNVSEYHSMNNPRNTEIWFARVSFADKTYEEVRNILTTQLSETVLCSRHT